MAESVLEHRMGWISKLDSAAAARKLFEELKKEAPEAMQVSSSGRAAKVPLGTAYLQA